MNLIDEKERIRKNFFLHKRTVSLLKFRHIAHLLAKMERISFFGKTKNNLKKTINHFLSIDFYSRYSKIEFNYIYHFYDITTAIIMIIFFQQLSYNFF